ncbi:MAG: protein translocase subunit SecD [Chloroflexi bacterium]|nr:MAG: protein translocase subunit SecD [Chloroflexota bacterium]
MNKNTNIAFVLILLLALVAAYLVWPLQHPTWVNSLLFWQPEGARSLEFRQGLDLQGGLQVLMVADVPEDDVEITSGALETARQVVENRVNALGLTEPVVQVQGSRRIIVELPGIDNPEQAVDTIRETALLEFAEPPLDVEQEGLRPGTPVTTTFGLTATGITTNATVFKTVMTGAALKDAYPGMNQQTNEWMVQFELQSKDADFFGDYTASHTDQMLCIILDKQIVSCPVIRSEIPDGKGTISGGFTYESADQLAIQLRYGALPIPLKIESYKAIGPSLGKISVDKSVRAGVIGLLVVFLFMLIYYRLNGLAADLALGLYVLLNLLLYKMVPITMTLPGIAGFLLSTGMAVDANILVFERMKEEIRRGRSLNNAAEAGFSRAWTSVRDSNLATLLTCAVLYFFGNAFAASLVKGFAITLALGTIVNIFTAIFVTRTFVRVAFGLFGDKVLEKPWLLGI